MPIIRLSKIIKDLNISMDRAVEYLQSKGVDVEKNPNVKLDQKAYDLLIQEFSEDKKQKKASNDVVINKIPEIRKPEKKVEPVMEPSKAKSKVSNDKTSEVSSTKKKEVKVDNKIEEKEEIKKTEQPEIEQVEEKVEKTEEEPKKQELKILGKIEPENLVRGFGKEEVKVEEVKVEEVKVEEVKVEEVKVEEVKVEIKEEEVEVVEIEGVVGQKVDEPKKVVEEKEEKVEKTKEENNAPRKIITLKRSLGEKDKTKLEEDKKTKEEEPEKIETVYKKLDGPKIIGQKIDLTQFDKKPSSSAADKKKRKRIVKDSKVNVNEVAKTIHKKGPGQANQPRPGGGNNNSNNNNRNNSNNNRPRREIKKPTRPVELSDEDVQKQIKDTLEKLTSKNTKSKGSKFRRDKRIQRRESEAERSQLEAMDNTLRVTEFITVNELASLMNVAPTEVISACFSLGVMVTMNQRLDADTLTLVADEFGYKVEFVDAEVEESIQEEADNEEDLLPRAPIVTVMGHVDHGKTSLLDYIREANVIAGESGGITQHIGAYNVELTSGQKITFLDTPGHEAFTAMRARGAQITDLAIIVVAADDDVMPQTKEAISHAQAAGVPMIFAINKIDKQASNPEKIKEQLANMNLLVEDWGGTIQSQEISAKFGKNVDLLLEKVLLEAEMLNLKANPDKLANGVVIEAALDKGRGYISTVLIQSGTLKIGDYLLAGKHHGKVKAMLDERGKPMKEAGPSMPVTVLGLDGAPTAGDKLKVFTDEKEAKQIANKRGQLQREQSIRTQKHITLDEIGRRIALGDFKELNIVLKGDVDGSVEALTDSLQKLSNDQIQINILHKGVGQITESDVLLAVASDAILIGFNVRPNQSARDLADKEEVEIRTYSIIYDAINEVKEAMEGMLSPEIKEQVIGNIEIREIFKISKVGTIAGCMVLDGKVFRNSKIRIIRDGIVVFTGELDSLKRFKDDAKEIAKGYECGLSVKNYNDIRVGDLLEVFEEIEVKKKLK